MASHYVKFEVYLPIKFTTEEGQEKSISENEIKEFSDSVMREFKGYTESNPAAAPPFKGYWDSRYKIHVDFLVSIFTLVALDKQEEAMRFFEAWKTELEKRLSQEFVLIYFYPIQVFGSL